ncbi:hypothetical protein ACF0H5_006007 [Mactra antiquata]
MEDQERPDDSLHDPDYNPEGNSSCTDDVDGTKPVTKKKKKLKSKKCTDKNIDENNNSTIEENNNVTIQLEENDTTVQLESFTEYKTQANLTRQCLCPLKCWEVVLFEWRKKAFDAYYFCGSWDLQTAYINAHVKTFNVDRRYIKGSPSKSRRQKSRHYYMDTDNGPRRVCKNVFIKTLDINSSRIHRALEKM